LPVTEAGVEVVSVKYISNIVVIYTVFCYFSYLFNFVMLIKYF